MRIALLLILASSLFATVTLSHASPDTPTSSADQKMGVNNKHRTVLQWNTYELISYNGKAYSWNTISLSWDNHNNISARFCNTVSARVPQVRDGYSRKIRAVGGGVISTLMYCDNAELMKMEDTFGKGLSEGMIASRTKQKVVQNSGIDEKLTFRTKSGDIFVFQYMATFME